MTIRTRFAPSPTGYLHIGGVRTALFNWLLARQSGGQFILRIDDTDQQRNVDEALQPILDGFKWLGIDWDEGPEVDGPYAPYYQSQRSDQHKAAVDRLLASGHAYRDFATNEETQAERQAAEKEKRDFIYSRHWMAETIEQAAAFQAEGREAVVRLKMPREGKCEFTDLIRGDVSFDWAREQDHVIQRKDGSCLYHLASVVDDEDFKITHVVRAEEHLSNTPRQIFIAQSLGYELPQYAHIPVVAEPGSKRKLSKRHLKDYLNNRDFKKVFDHAMSIMERLNRKPDPELFNPVIVDFYRECGYLPHAVINYLLLLGWSLDDKTEFFTQNEMIEQFSLDRVQSSPASFDPMKLDAFQEHYFVGLPEDEKVGQCLPFLIAANLVGSDTSTEDIELTKSIVRFAGDRIKVAGDILDYDDFFAADAALEYDEKAFQKRLIKPENAGFLLAEFKKILSVTDDYSATNMEYTLKQFVESQSIKIGDIIHAVRVALTGKAAGFGMFETMEVLGKNKCLARIDRALEALASNQQQGV